MGTRCDCCDTHEWIALTFVETYGWVRGAIVWAKRGYCERKKNACGSRAANKKLYFSIKNELIHYIAYCKEKQCLRQYGGWTNRIFPPKIIFDTPRRAYSPKRRNACCNSAVETKTHFVKQKRFYNPRRAYCEKQATAATARPH